MNLSFVFVFFFLNGGKAAVKKWLPTSDVLNPKNWIGNDGCKGIHFPFITHEMMNLGSVNVAFLELPYDGDISLNGDITFDENSETCIKIKELVFHSWYDPRNWNASDNKAIPDLERLPCDYDEVMFDENSSVPIIGPVILQVQSIIFNGHKFKDFGSSEDLESSNLEVVNSLFSNVVTTGHDCKDDYCLCHVDDNFVRDSLCVEIMEIARKETFCDGLIKPEGFCSGICGAFILLSGYTDLSPVKKFLNDYKEHIDYHYSTYFLSGGFETVQIVIVDKEESNGGFYSIQVGMRFEKYYLANPELFKSEFIVFKHSSTPVKQIVGVVLGIVFGALLVTIIFFTVIYIVYIGSLRNYRFNVRSWSHRSNFKPFVFARFDNKDEGTLSFVSPIEKYEKSFDNPMYGKEIPSTSKDFIEMQDDAPRESNSEDDSIDEVPTKYSQMEIEDVK